MCMNIFISYFINLTLLQWPLIVSRSLECTSWVQTHSLQKRSSRKDFLFFKTFGWFSESRHASKYQLIHKMNHLYLRTRPEQRKQSLGSDPVHHSQNRGHPSLEVFAPCLYTYQTLGHWLGHFSACCALIGHCSVLILWTVYERAAFTSSSSKTGTPHHPSPKAWPIHRTSWTVGVSEWGGGSLSNRKKLSLRVFSVI